MDRGRGRLRDVRRAGVTPHTDLRARHFDPVLDHELDQIEQFFRERGAPTFHEVSSFATPETLNRLSVRGDSPFETSTVLVRPITASTLAGAATIPSARKQGAQRALLQARLAFAAARGVSLAMVVTAPGSASQRNAERQGFRPVYMRAKWKSSA